jgi:ADP-ribosylglycohydrolase
MLGAIIGDIVGSVYERNNIKTKEFPLFRDDCFFTDDTIMTCATAEAIMNGGEKDDFIDAYKKFGRMYPDAGYGHRFKKWIFSETRKPYNSYGNGSAMRVSPVGFYAKSLEEALQLAKTTAEVSHNHSQGIKGAQAIASSIYLALNGKSKEEIKEYVETEFGYNLRRSCDDIRPMYRFDVTCQGSCPQAIIAFLESSDYESAIRLAVSLGGDSDTIACMAGGIAAAFYGVQDDIVVKAREYLSEDIIKTIESFEAI